MSRRSLWGALAAAGMASLLAADLPRQFTPQQRRWWAFQKVVKPAVPVPEDRAWGQNDIDAFILSRLEEKKLTPAPPADRITLIRRATLDLTGLVPTPEEVQAFVSDPAPGAFAKVVDRLLASPRYGERWARHWLDLARYADSEGFKSDETRPNIWRYRDYVVDSFNQDKPYDRFIKEQIAGDELYPEDPAALVATGFNRHFPDESNARRLMLRRQEILNDITDTVGSVFLGLTYGCAKCHDHKFDPILHRLIMLSSTYQESARFDPAAVKIDPEDRLAWRYNRHRLEGEAIRDSILEVSGRLNLKMGGPGVFPPLPPGVETRGGWKKDEDPSEADRRSVYVFVRRNTRYPMFEVFDMPDTHESCPRRNATVTAPQALELLNNELVADWARSLSGRVWNDAGLTPQALPAFARF